jgi:2-iminobutanoate/2-iminopropanoate deaminase
MNLRMIFGAVVSTVVLAALPALAEKKAITPAEFGTGSSPFSPGMLVDGTLYVAGQIGRDLKTGEIPSDFEQEAKLCLENIGIVLKAAGMNYQDVVSVTVYLTDMDQFAKMNGVYTKFFPEPRPARTTAGVAKLAAAKAKIEITVTAHR